MAGSVEIVTVSREAGALQYKMLDNTTVANALKELDLAQPPAEGQ